MTNEQPASTTTLVQRLQLGQDDTAELERLWRELVDRYSTLLLRCGQRCGLVNEDAEDVAQQTLLNVLRFIDDFDRRKAKFKTWVGTIWNRERIKAWKKRRRQKQVPGGNPEIQNLLDQSANEVPPQRLDEIFDQELLRRAMECARERVEPTTWQCYQLTVEAGLSADEAADRLAIEKRRLAVNKSRVLSLIREEYKKLEEGQ